MKPNKPDAGNKQPGLSKTGASVSGVFGAFAALLAVGAGAALAAAVGASPGAESADRHMMPMPMQSVGHLFGGRPTFC